MIGILGAYGAVGIWATRFIRNNSDYRLRIGGRNIEKAPSELRTEWNDAEWTKVDVSSKKVLNSLWMVAKLSSIAQNFRKRKQH
jgi:hypothetical protein